MSDNDPQLILVERQKIKEYIWANQDYFFWRGFMSGTAYALGTTAIILYLNSKIKYNIYDSNTNKLGKELFNIYKTLLH